MNVNFVFLYLVTRGASKRVFAPFSVFKVRGLKRGSKQEVILHSSLSDAGICVQYDFHLCFAFSVFVSSSSDAGICVQYEFVFAVCILFICCHLTL